MGQGVQYESFLFCVVAMVTAGAVRYVWRSSAETNRQVLFYSFSRLYLISLSIKNLATAKD